MIMDNPILYDRIWFEIYDAKLKEVYLSHFLAKRSRVRNILDIIIVLVSVTGAASYSFCPVVTFFSAIITAALSIVACCVPAVVPREEDLSAISKVVSFYTEYVSSLERLYAHLYSGTVSPESAEAEFYRLHSSVTGVEASVNRFLHRNRRRIEAEAVAEADRYVNNVFKSI